MCTTSVLWIFLHDIVVAANFSHICILYIEPNCHSVKGDLFCMPLCHGMYRTRHILSHVCLLGSVKRSSLPYPTLAFISQTPPPSPPPVPAACLYFFPSIFWWFFGHLQSLYEKKDEKCPHQSGEIMISA